jgi:DNA-binding CsgD family transcriptional regulator
MNACEARLALAERGKCIGGSRDSDDVCRVNGADRPFRSEDCAMLRSVLDYMPRPVIVVGPQGRIAHLNAAAIERLEQMPMIEAKQGLLRFVGPGGDALRDAFEAAAHVQSALPSSVLIRTTDGPKMVFTFLPLDGREPGQVLIVSQELPLALAVPRRLRALLGLTAAEAEVAIRLAEGATLRAIAAERGVAETTVKVQLKTLMRKLGCRRQLEVAVLLRSLLPVHGYD